MNYRTMGVRFGFALLALVAAGAVLVGPGQYAAFAQTVSSSTINGITVKVIGGGNQSLGAHEGGAKAVLNGNEVLAVKGQVTINGNALKAGDYSEVSLQAVDRWGLKVMLDGKPFHEVSVLDGLMAAAENGDSVAQNNLGVRYLTGDGVKKDPQRAVELYTAAAEQGAMAAQSNLANLYWRGTSIERDSSQAVKWAEKAAKQGSENVLFILARAHETGDGTSKDLKKAVEWYTRAADAGQPPGINNLATFYLLGNVVDKDVDKAIALYKKASKLGDATASNNLGIIYRGGKETEKNLELAKQYFTKAVEQKHPLAGGSLKEVEAELAAAGNNAGGTTMAQAQPPQLPSAGGSPPPLPGTGSDGGPPPLPGATNAAGPPPLPTMEIYYAGPGGQRLGPVDETVIAEKVASGELNGDTLVWQKGMAGWSPMAEVPELAGILAQAQSGPPPLPQQQQQQYHVLLQGQQQGPFGTEQIRQMAQNGQVTAETMVWTEGMDGWQPLNSRPELAALVPAGQTPPPLPGGGQTPAPTPPQPGNNTAQQFKVRSFCSATGKEGFGTGETPQIAMQKAVKQCVANGGLPNCCPNDVKLVQ